jgi:hypothetical protein
VEARNELARSVCHSRLFPLGIPAISITYRMTREAA